MPSLARPPAKVTAWPSLMPTSKARVGIASSISDIDVPLGMAAVMPTILSFFRIA
jgi:hypothetical protein